MSMNISRRAFMKGAAASSLAVAASTMLTGCSMPNLGDIFGGIFGDRAKTITVAEGETISITLVNYDVDTFCNEALPEFKIVNNTKCGVQVASSAQGVYVLEPTIKYVGLSGATPSVNWSHTTVKDVIPAGETATGKLAVAMNTKDWTSIELTLTAKNGSGIEVGEPVVFSF